VADYLRDSRGVRCAWHQVAITNGSQQGRSCWRICCCVLSLGRRLSLLQAAHAAGAWIVEDDYDSEFRYTSLPQPSLQSLDEHSRVIYVGSFSKTLCPGLRLGYVVLPPALVEPFAALKSTVDDYSGKQPDVLGQAARQ
jgi:GntR family transcriptional regulator/MocR family aminotransferase